MSNRSFVYAIREKVMRRYLVLPVLVALAGCTLSQEKQTPAPETQYVTKVDPHGTWVSGFAWDPEAYYFTFLACNPAPPPAPPVCFAPPLLIPGFPSLEASVMQGAMVGLFDPAAAPPGPTYMIPAPTQADGVWQIGNVETRPAPPFLALGIPPNDASTALHVAPPPPPGTNLLPDGTVLPPPPPVPVAAAYLPTLTLQPIWTGHTQCMDEPAAEISTNGVLQAVAKNQSIAVTDLLDPKQHGGVAVVSLFFPTSGPDRVPAIGTIIQADHGTVYNISWQPPGTLPPLPDGGTMQSDRGFFVPDPSKPGPPPIGMAVVVLPPAQGPTPVQFTFTDPVTDPSQGRPLQYPPVPAQMLAPGTLSYLGVPANAGNPPPPTPPFLCLNPL